MTAYGLEPRPEGIRFARGYLTALILTIPVWMGAAGVWMWAT